MEWMALGTLEEIPAWGGRYVETPEGQIAILRNENDEVFAVSNQCPHRGGPLSEGFVSGKLVFCPLHNWQIDLEKGEAVAPDSGCVKRFPIRMEGEQIWLGLQEIAP
ncbi:nitrite reductase small subunit NirD [Acidithiobacillus sp. 'AMD consortium']|jgi:nitrite reductase (NADH) small subunit|uniref:Assimilatory nitrite reductase [NAD(P)H] small subunit n=2 Tax=Acidithiobacillus ferridurans TaxID=1232575 RepID=A0A2Z6IMB2_ACIFI|nr:MULTISPECIES: nitrite reductase small subunit NirD [Acidithiobacillus]MBU2715348.1 nitrite reductase small subunit NirD [Acidithiobacillus ferridurans]MBU2720029.1 nitrite reductase small subunit NirD [Acidithiobacillus ferridurans]MBU2723363.1 nitrite reductase small subunit NirD [Acidithiobacillus ferridurans]MBU2726207.1 nitrite reductase small subunit NirD [Acidithiobacillus ferridurans]MBU2804397.1 nitrite reductase small subunit NirD [Acidithiobacillus ferridurans]